MKVILGIVLIFLVLMVTDDYTEQRQDMVERQILSRGITDAETISAMMKVPRHLFVPDDMRSQAYFDYPLPIGYGQTISQPYIVALMTSSLQLEGNETVLEIGTGSGYQAAVLAEIVHHVYTIEIVPELAQRAEAVLKDLEYSNVTVRNADGYFGWEENGPYDAVMITAAVDHIPPPLVSQLREDGRLILPLGNPLYYQALTLVEKRNGELFTRHVCDVQFVPLTGFAQGQHVEEDLDTTGEKAEEENADEKERAEPGGYTLCSPAVVLLVLAGAVIILWAFSSRTLSK
ncbi:MAG: protein-L-isoaspartate(D-aspartate) O-methyltransferase [Theionarchaea archaeon]|nr:protein-L-isoaspartate(D-aspartate) O-methyltransferase [Theionarchaea archaeon]MBU7019453.1 protein-L-isoaspartate(D-aspartate) O-methyltransferase [Theionarchaea archaeon]MBU7035759.1 protein-L-isoaspartate(D-aspartate) O-methyltransferase [Theionarchaea archaeon]MBU7041346.1 protein-L-isoaspartate(D-aspartate) O-methyltransferase [Theionarchaea archaeon]